MEPIFNFLLDILAGYLLADFVLGIYHWFKDTYFGPFTPFIGKHMIWGSRLHHIRPRYVCEFSDWQLFWSSAKWTLIWMGPLFLFAGPTPFLAALFLVISLNDVIHKYAHMLDDERPRWASFLQKIYVFQTYDEHHLHHISPHEVNYCPITPYVNIVLEELNFWRWLEGLVEKYTGAKARAHNDEFIEDPAYPAGIKFLQTY